MKQETLTEAAFNYAAQRFPNEKGKHCGTVALEQYACRKGFFAGIEYQKHQQIEQESGNNLKRYRYPKNGQIYVVRSECRMKHPVTREWIDAVIYIQENGTEIYVREAEEFTQRFEEL